MFFMALVFGTLLGTSNLFAAGDTEPEAAQPADGAVATEAAYDTYHWATPAEFETATGTRVGSYKEAPVLTEMVNAGRLPPVDERLPEEPLVLGKEIGSYGGTMFMANPFRAFRYGAEPYRMFTLGMPSHTWSYDIYPNLAKGWEMEDGGRAWVVHLREGTRWSDGEPYTADDIMFWWEDVTTMEVFPDVFTRHQMDIGIYKGVSKIDDYTVRFEFHDPTEVLFSVQAGKAISAFPVRYMKQFHASHADAEALDALVKEGGHENWLKLFANRTDDRGQYNTEKPTLLPWTLVQTPPDDVIMERNPYYWAVDYQGQQLPYIDKLHMFSGLDREVVHLKALAGELDMAVVDMETFRVARERESQGKIAAANYADTATSAARISVNLNHKDATLRELFRDKRFRFALSHAINREQINELVYFGMSEPSQATSAPDSPYYHERLARAYIEYDQDTANQLLDQVGLSRRGADGFRLGPDGGKLQITFVSLESGAMPRIAEMVTDDLKAVGLDVNLRTAPTSLLRELRNALELEITMIPGNWGSNEGAFFAGLDATHVLPTHVTNTFWAPLWQTWYGTQGADGEQPIPEVLRAIELYYDAVGTIDNDVRGRKWAEINDIAADNLWTIGTVRNPGYFKVYSSRLANWPTEPRPWDRGGDVGRPEIYFLRD